MRQVKVDRRNTAFSGVLWFTEHFPRYYLSPFIFIPTCDTGKADSCYCHFTGKLTSSHPLFLNMSHLVNFQEALTQHLPYPHTLLLTTFLFLIPVTITDLAL